ncbi:MAG: type I phosphomannose isomerase catalytic subunit [Fervidobacterium sp.]
MKKVIPQFRKMIWGNWKLNELFDITFELPVGEVWLVSGHPLIENRLSNDITVNEFGRSVYGNKYPRFPILIKLVSTNQWLSIQVHPDDDYAKNFENEPWGKAEAWYFLTDGEFAICTEVDKLKRIMQEDQTKLSDCIADTMQFVKVKKGTIVYLPPGTVHALGPNTSVIEVQQTSDLTYRIYDWGRGRDTHIEKAIKVIKHINLFDIIFEDTKKLVTDYFTIQVNSIRNILQDNIKFPIIAVKLNLDKEFCATIIEDKDFKYIDQGASPTTTQNILSMEEKMLFVHSFC